MLHVHCKDCNYDSGDCKLIIDLIDKVEDDGGHMTIINNGSNDPEAIWDVKCPQGHPCSINNKR